MADVGLETSFQNVNDHTEVSVRMFYQRRADFLGLFSSRRRISSDEIPPSDFCLARDRSMRAIKLGLLLKDTVSISALGMLTRIATGLPSFVMITGSFFTSFVLSESGNVAFKTSTVFIVLLPLL
jgi:hypothetical protein